MFTYKRKITFHDCDPAGILFFARIYEICHTAYENMIESFELEEDYWNNEKHVVPIIKSEARYNKPLKYGDEVSVEVKVTSLRDSSFELNYNCKNKNGEVCSVVRTVHVFIDKNSWEKIKMPERIKAGLQENQ